MAQTITWLMPLFLLPGIGVLLVSTSARYSQIHNEVHTLLHEGRSLPGRFVQHLFLRAKLFRNALVSLYLGAVTFALGSIIGAVAEIAGGNSNAWVVGFTTLGIGCLIFAAANLIRESMLVLRVFEYHLNEISRKNHEETSL
jgi:hypothetical protein